MTGFLLMSITPESVETLLNSHDFGDRLRAVNQIRQLPPEIAFPLIQKATQDSNPRVRYAAVSQIANLGKHNPELAENILRDRLQDEEADVQAAAADSIGALGLTNSFTALQQLYQNTSEWLVQFSIVAALGELGDRRAFDLLKEALDSGNELLQTAAIGSLGELGDARAVMILTPYATNPDWQIRYRLAQALSRLEGDACRTTLEQLARDEVVQVAEEAKSHL
jgi:HEAT repeat protein